ncbi:hypothetical protein [uncultured Nocardioides sp.]|uniref:hypothetical protein n=1 Tax=uncultured Nocardioides sp. TaxID=198441 RepID=UPI00262AE2DA|nr:hypothetical protein [uncultured Nocardioides sp.]
MLLPPPVLALASRQSGVVSRRQLVGVGACDGDLRSWLRHRLLVVVHRGVYVTHTGALSWSERAWAAVLYAELASLHGPSAILASLGRSRQVSEKAAIQVAVELGRRPSSPEGVVVRRVARFEERSLLGLSPPRARIEDAALDAAAEATDDLGAIAVLAEVVGSRRTTPARITAALDARGRIERRVLHQGALSDLSLGACSVLEREYLNRVERAHGLPAAARQVRASARGSVFRDVLYGRYRAVVELDGRADHTHLLDRDRDLERDLHAVEDGLVTLRLGHGQVHDRACATAGFVGRALVRGGWTGRPRRCARCR